MKRLLFFVSLLSASSVQAGLITYKGHTLDTSTNIVTNIETGLEWMRWDLTIGETISSARSGIAQTFDGGGWKLASNAQMGDLFNTFSGTTDFGSNESTYYSTPTSYIEGEDVEDSFVLQLQTLFGVTMQLGSGERGDARSLVYFGSDANGNGLYNMTNLRDDQLNGTSKQAGYMELAMDTIQTTSRTRISFQNTIVNGVALVRQGQPVPEPGSIALLIFGLCGLRLRASQRPA